MARKCAVKRQEHLPLPWCAAPARNERAPGLLCCAEARAPAAHAPATPPSARTMPALASRVHPQGCGAGGVKGRGGCPPRTRRSAARRASARLARCSWQAGARARARFGRRRRHSPARRWPMARSKPPVTRSATSARTASRTLRRVRQGEGAPRGGAREVRGARARARSVALCALRAALV